ncbi:MAG: TolC family protein [Acidobacteria bacterium]|nr:TolC family protein [Acidobacteriota bacterium]
MRQQRSRAARVGLLAACVFGLAASTFAQTPQAPAPPGPVRQLSMEDAIKLALENNLSLQVERINPQLQDQSIEQAKTAWTPNLTAGMSSSSRTSPISGFFSGATDKLIRDSFSSNVGANQLLPWGANYNVTWDTSRAKSNSVYDSPNPAKAANLNFSFTQPLLKNLKVDSARQQLVVSKKNRELSDIELRQTVLTTVRSVKYAYWNLKASVAALQVARQSLDLAKESLRNNRSKVEIGTMAPIDVVEAEAEVARRNEAVITAQATVRRAEDALRTLILDSKSADYWAVKFDLTEQPVFAATSVDIEGTVKTALEKRTDLQQARKNLEITDATIHYQRNQILPDLNAQVGYGLSGQGGTKLNFGAGFPPPVIGEINEGFGTMMNRLLSNDFHNWSFAVQFSYPIGTGAAEANLARTRLQKSQALLQLENLELQVSTSVRDVARNVETNQERLASTQATRKLMERRLEAEQKKFAAGLSTNFLVFQAQRDLADAQYSELVALLDYNKSLVDLETVQEAPTAGSASVTVVR